MGQEEDPFPVRITCSGSRKTHDFRHRRRGAPKDRLIGQNLHDTPCRNEAPCGNPIDEVVRTCWSATCAFPLTATARCWICSATRSSPPPLTSWSRRRSQGRSKLRFARGCPAWNRKDADKCDSIGSIGEGQRRCQRTP